VFGYVSNFDLVVFSVDEQLPFTLAGTELDFGTPFVTAHLVPLGGDPLIPLEIGPDGNAKGTPTAFRIVDGVLGGRVSVNQMLQTASAASSAPDQDAGVTLPGCNGADFDLLKSLVCGAADIQANPNRDFTDAGCDAISIAFQFGAAPAMLGRQHSSTTPDFGTCDAAVFACPE
jgi:hypothetical protein